MVETPNVQSKKMIRVICCCIVLFVFQIIIIPAVGLASETQVDLFDKANQLIVMIKGKFDERETFGAGIIFGRERNKLYIVTADHVVRKQSQTAQDIRIMLKDKPDVKLKALLLNRHQTTKDIAVLSVDLLKSTKFDVCSLAMTALGKSSQLKRGSKVFPVGYPTGIPWGSPFDPDRVSQIIGDKVTIQSRFIAAGHSGGALLNEAGEIVGLIRADSPPLGLAISIENVLKVVGGWGYPIQLSSPVPHGGTALHRAAANDDVPEIRKLMKRPCADVNITDIKGNTPLHSAASVGSFKAAKLLLTQGAPRQLKNTKGNTPFHVAAVHGQLEILKLLHEHGADLNLQNSDGKIPLQVAFNHKQKGATLFLLNAGSLLPSSSLSPALYIAVKEQWIEVVNILIENGAKFNWSNKDHKLLLHHAVKKSNEKLVQILLRAGANPDEFSGSLRNTPLGIAGCQMLGMMVDRGCKGNEKIVLLLLKAGAKKSGFSKGYEGRQTMLHVAVRKGWIPTTKYLLKEGANPDHRHPLYGSNLYAAIDKGRRDILELLLEAGADPDAARERLTPIMYAIKKGRLEMVLPLVQAGANLWVRDDNGNTVYDLAVQLEDPELKKLLIKALKVETQLQSVRNPKWPRPEFVSIVRNGKVKEMKRLLESGINPNLRDRKVSAHSDYTYHGNTALFEKLTSKMFDLLIEAGANVNARGVRSQTPLHWLMTNDPDPVILKKMLKAKALVNARTQTFSTPLHHAVGYRRWPLVKILLEAGADPCAKDLKGKTPFSNAIELDRADIFRSFFKKKNYKAGPSLCG